MQWGWNSGCRAGAALILLAALAAGAEEAEAPAPSVPLDRLLEVPRDVEVSTRRQGGASRDEWRARFAEVRTQRAQAQAALEAAQKELEGIAADTSQWQMTAPGLGGVQAASGGEQGPLSYRLKQEIRRQREEIERADQRLQELRVQANLAGVPEEWIAEEEPPASGSGAVADPTTSSR